MPPQQVFIIVRPPPSKGVDLRNLQIQLVNTTRTNTAHPSKAKAGAPTPPPHALGKETEGHFGADEGVPFEGRGQGSGTSAHQRPWTTSGSASTSTLGAKSFDAVAAATIVSPDGPIRSAPDETDPSSPHLTLPTAPRPSHPGSTEMIRSTSWQSDKSSSSAISTKSSLSSSIGSTGTSYSIGGSSVGTKGSGGGVESGRDRRGRGSMRRVTPLYNLSFHALLQTVVTDAGTDEKIAKFSKKGTIEMMEFALLEPVDLRAPLTSSTPSTSSSTVTSPLALIRSRVAEESTKGGQSPTGGLLSKLIKLGMGKAAMRGNGGGTTGGMTASTSSRRLSINDPRPSLAQADQTVTVVSPRRKLPRGHAFTLAKFLRNDLVEARDLTGMNVRFEWKRLEKKRSTETRNQNRYKSPGKGGSDRTVGKDEEGRLVVSLEGRGSRMASVGEGSGSDVSIGSERALGELDRTATGFEGIRLSSAGSADEAQPEQSDHEDVEEEEEDSDLEDSDRPWSCTLYFTQSNTPQSPSEPPSEPWSLPLAHLLPAPYHPRLVANLSFSPTLADVRLGNGAGFSEEELKDVVSVTALWVVARDGLGGRVGGGGGGLKVGNGKGKGRKGSFGGG